MSGTDYTQTTNYGLYKPISNADINQWGSHLNANADTIDGVMHGFLPLAGGTPTGPIYITATGGSVARSAQNRAADMANVLDYGADPTGVADSSVAFNAAAAHTNPVTGRRVSVYVPSGNYRINRQISLTDGQSLLGDGPGTSVLYISDAFDPAASSVVLCTSSVFDPGPTISNIMFWFEQPGDVANRGTFKTLLNGGTSHSGGTGVMYPWCIATENQANRIIVRNVNISAGWNGIEANHACFWIDGLRICAMNIGISVGGTVAAQVADWDHFSDIEFWPFGMSTANLQNVFNDGNTIAMQVGSINGLSGQNISCLSSRIIFTSDFSAGWATLTNLNMDSPGAALVVNDARFLQIANLYIAGGNDVRPGVEVLAGNVQIANFLGFGTGPYALLQNRGGDVVVNNFHFTPYNVAANAVFVDGGGLRMTNGRIYPGTTGAWTAAIIHQDGSGSLQIGNVDLSGQPGSSGTAVWMNTDSGSNILGDVTLGPNWTNSIPYGNPPAGRYGGGAVFVAPKDGTSIQAGGNSFTVFDATSHFSTGFGYLALSSHSASASGNTALGGLAGYGVTTGNNNTFIGSTSGQGLSGSITGNGNTCIGAITGINLTTGANNTIVGEDVAVSLTTGSNNIMIGTAGNAQVAIGSESNTFRLAGGGTNLMRAININTTLPKFFLDWLPGSTTYANDAAAATGGVAVGQLYRNGSVVQVRVL